MPRLMKTFTVFVVLLASLRSALGQGGISTSHFCTGISSVDTLQEVIYADAAKQSSCIKFIGEDDGQYAASMFELAECHRLHTRACVPAGR